MASTTQHPEFTLAIIGGGGACVAFLHHFVASISAEQAQGMRIQVFEPRNSVGPGLAYHPDVDSLLLNRVAETMSVCARDFSTFSAWLRWKAHHAEELKAVSNTDLAEAFVPRAIFGRFLSDFFAETCAIARRKHLQIEVVQARVTAIDKDRRYRLSAAGTTYIADRVVLAVGNTGPRDHYGLDDHYRFIRSPYPISEQIAPTLIGQRICVIGSGLTAVDVVLSLQALGFTGQIDMISRSGRLPFVRGLPGPRHPLQFLTHAALEQLTQGGARQLALRSLLRLLRAELRAIHCDWRTLFRSDNDPLQHLHEEVAAATQRRDWQLVLAATNEVIEYAWNALDSADQQTITRHFAKDWLARRAPMPLANALKLKALIETGRLRLLAGDVRFEGQQEDLIKARYAATAETCEYDYVVNATGAAKWVECEQDSGVLWQLQQDGHALRDERGGLQVEFASGALLDRHRQPDPHLRLLGHMTSGTYFFVSSLEMIAKRARHMAEDLIRSLPPYLSAPAAPLASPSLAPTE
jgi:uncharacterized NAD(P)/FAD-binding protein YdhS